MEYDEKCQIAQNKDINELVPFIEKALNQKISPQEILEVNNQKLNKNVKIICKKKLDTVVIYRNNHVSFRSLLDCRHLQLR